MDQKLLPVSFELDRTVVSRRNEAPFVVKAMTARRKDQVQTAMNAGRAYSSDSRQRAVERIKEWGSKAWGSAES